ncbi:TRAP transporter small permease [Oceanicola sp. S124]|uniref:TRAP transporter small permease n=1 Tax=Oceanicola sp. S124 TaxID=1042378 RepID=UPI0002559406|nr:TRAP transporter small permease [Oceanicola sp. S124]
MAVANVKGALSVTTDRASYVLAVIAAVLLLSMVVVLAAGVSARYFFANPILGLNEIVQLNAVALVMLALPYATASGVHVRADIFDPFITRWGRFAGDLVTRAISIVALWQLVDRAWWKALDAHEFEDVTNMLELPLWPFYGLIGLGMALCIAVLAIQFLPILISGRPENE